MLYYLFVEKNIDIEDVFSSLKSVNIAHINFLEIVEDNVLDKYIKIKTNFFGPSYVKEKLTTELNNLGYTTTQFTIVQPLSKQQVLTP